jgi:hypothetical protein
MLSDRLRAGKKNDEWIEKRDHGPASNLGRDQSSIKRERSFYILRRKYENRILEIKTAEI